MGLESLQIGRQHFTNFMTETRPAAQDKTDLNQSKYDQLLSFCHPLLLLLLI